MGNIQYVVAVLLVIGWAIGYFAFHMAPIIHVPLIIALVISLFRVIKGKQAF